MRVVITASGGGHTGYAVALARDFTEKLSCCLLFRVGILGLGVGLSVLVG